MSKYTYKNTNTVAPNYITDSEGRIAILCMGITYMSQPCPDQKNVELGPCEKCTQMMWISEKKRDLRKLSGERIILLCHECMADLLLAQEKNNTRFSMYDMHSRTTTEVNTDFRKKDN